MPQDRAKGKSQVGEYGDLVTQTDWAACQVMAAPERNKVASNTLIVLTSDNGSREPDMKPATIPPAFFFVPPGSMCQGWQP